MSLIQLFWDVQTSTINWFNPSMGRFSNEILSFPTNNGPKVNQAPCRYVNIALMQSYMSNLMKISKSCFKVMQRTLRSGRNWLSYPSFSVISRVKWKRDHTFKQVLPVRYGHFCPILHAVLPCWGHIHLTPHLVMPIDRAYSDTCTGLRRLYVPDIQLTRSKAHIEALQKVYLKSASCICRFKIFPLHFWPQKQRLARQIPVKSV